MEQVSFEISEDGFPDLAAMMLATLSALKSLGGSGTIQEIDDQVIDDQKIDEKIQKISMPNSERRPKVNYYLAWSRTYLKKAGAIENSKRGVWALNEVGTGIQTYDEVRELYKSVQGHRNSGSDQTKDQEIDIEETVENWKAQLLNVLIGISPDGFERLSQRLLREAGFTKVEVRGKSGDGGIDGLGILRVNLVSFQVYFQCKRWKGNVGSKEIRDFRGAIQGRADKGLFITTGDFTNQAREEATRDGAIAIDLIDGETLCDLLKENQLGVTTHIVEQVEIFPDWFRAV